LEWVLLWLVWKRTKVVGWAAKKVIFWPLSLRISPSLKHEVHPYL